MVLSYTGFGCNRAVYVSSLYMAFCSWRETMFENGMFSFTPKKKKKITRANSTVISIIYDYCFAMFSVYSPVVFAVVFYTGETGDERNETIGALENVARIYPRKNRRCVSNDRRISGDLVASIAVPRYGFNITTHRVRTDIRSTERHVFHAPKRLGHVGNGRVIIFRRYGLFG